MSPLALAAARLDDLFNWLPARLPALHSAADNHRLLVELAKLL